ncbi:MAG: phosphopantetheine-binding protein [Polaromonas sp.]
MSELAMQTSTPKADAALLLEIAELVVSALNLEVVPADIQADEQLYGDGLGLDSIDILEIALVVSKQYGLQLRADGEDNHAIFQSLRSLGDHIAVWRTK